MNSNFFLEGSEFCWISTGIDLGSYQYWLEGYPAEGLFPPGVVGNLGSMLLLFDW